MSFIDLSALGLSVDQDSLLQDWLTVMQTLYPGYVPADGNPEYVDAQALANLFADGSQAALIVPSAIVRAFGTKLHNIPYLPGVAATASVQVTAVDGSGYTLPAGTDLTLGVYGFYTQSDLVISPGSMTGVVTVFATSPGSASNGAGSPAELMATFDWVSGVTALAGAFGGVDAESDDAYQNRLAQQLSLVAPRPITAQNFATMAYSFFPPTGTDAQEIGRATAIDGYQPGNAAFTVSLNSTSVATITTPPAAGVYPAQGATITGTDIPAGTIVLSATTSSITMSHAATGTASVTATVGGTLGNERTVTVIAADATGNQWAGGTEATDTLADLATWLKSFREANFVVNAIAPAYTTVYVTVSCVLYPGFDAAATATAIQAAIVAFLSPETFGAAAFGDSGQWFSGCTIYQSQLMAVIQNAGQGAVQNVVDGSLKFGTASVPTNTADLVLPGPVGLPQSDATTVTVTIA